MRKGALPCVGGVWGSGGKVPLALRAEAFVNGQVSEECSSACLHAAAFVNGRVSEECSSTRWSAVDEAWEDPLRGRTVGDLQES